MERFIPKDEVSRAFSGHAVYRRGNANGLLSLVGALIRRKRTYVGVWGKRNTARFRRFLQERGAHLTIHRHAPPDLRLAYWATANERRRVRSLSRQDT